MNDFISQNFLIARDEQKRWQSAKIACNGTNQGMLEENVRSVEL
jgi:hypothetical protein